MSAFEGSSVEAQKTRPDAFGRHLVPRWVRGLNIRSELLSLLLGAVLAITFLNFALRKIVDLNNAALGGQTTAVLAEVDGQRMACFDASDTDVCENAYKRAGDGPAVLWFGNSQNFAINRYKPGDELAVVRVHKWLKNRGTWLVSYAQPNANFDEQAVLFESLIHRYNTRLVILPLFMDKLREQGIRDTVAAFMNDPKTAEQVRRSPEWPDVAPLLIKETEPEPERNLTIQAKVEDQVNSLLDQYWPLWRGRSMLRGNVGFVLHQLRNKFFGIHSYTKRPVDPQVYAEKLDVLSKMLQSARDQHVRMLLYIPPYRHDISGPYEDVQYARFKADVRALAVKYDANFVDLDNTVPGPLWATVVDTVLGFEEPDFMHFTAEGHSLLAKAIEDRLVDLGF
jgi:hypothetical protein